MFYLKRFEVAKEMYEESERKDVGDYTEYEQLKNAYVTKYDVSSYRRAMYAIIFGGMQIVSLLFVLNGTSPYKFVLDTSGIPAFLVVFMLCVFVSAFALKLPKFISDVVTKKRAETAKDISFPEYKSYIRAASINKRV